MDERAWQSWPDRAVCQRWRVVSWEKGVRVPLCYFVAKGSAQPRFGLIAGDRIIDLASAGGPPSLSAALQLSASEFLDALNTAARKSSDPSV